jgi:hypothetical protein
MTEQELERALRQALPQLHPEADLVERICARLDSATPSDTPATPASAHRHWLPAAIAATVLLAFGFAQWAQLQHQHQLQVRTQLLQGLTIASASLKDARNAVLQSEGAAP